MSFTETSREIARDFLRTCVVIDDAATFNAEAEPEQPREEDVVDPEEGFVDAAAVEGTSQSAGDSPARSSGTPLDAKAIADGFAALGLFCSVIRPASSEEALLDRTTALARRADLVVLDWNIYGDDGQTVRSLVDRLLAPDAEQDRYRVIAIYTGEKDLPTIASDLKKHIDGLGSGFQELSDSSGLAFYRGHTLIGVYAKEGTEGAIPEVREREVSPQALAERLVDDFATVTCGLLANMVMKSLGVLRRYTHRILGKFDRSLDAPFITHRTMSSPPQDVEEQVVPLVVAEIEAVLNDQAVFDTVCASAVDEYLRDASASGTSLHLVDADSDKALEILGALVRMGPAETKKIHNVEAVKWVHDREKKFPQYVGKFTNALQGEDSEDTSRDEKFSMLMNVRSRYTAVQPVLAPGVVVAQDTADGSAYWLCVQPTCDCVRLFSPRRFLFLPLTVTKDGSFDAMFEDGTQVRRLKISRKLYDGKQFEFAPTNGAIEAIDRFGASVFVSTNLDFLRYVCRLKLEHGLRATERLSSNISRIGLTESEWFRVNAPKD